MALGSDIPDELQAAIQQGFLKEDFERALRGSMAYGMAASPEPVRARKGNTLTLTRMSSLAAKTTPISQSAKNGDLNNGLTPSQMSVEQYTLTMNEYMDTLDLNIMDDQVVVAAQGIKFAGALGEGAASTLEQLARNALLNAGMSGNSRVVSEGTSPTTTHCQVDDVRGFQYILVDGVRTAVSGANPLTVYEIANGGGGVTQTLSVTGVAVDGTNVSRAAAAGGISGVITFATATTPVVTDILLAANKSDMIRPNGRRGTHLLTAADVFSTGMAMDMQVVLDNNGTPRFPNGDFLCFVSPTSHRQLFADPSFEQAYQGQYNSAPHRKGVITSHQGVTYVRTNFAVRQSAAGAVTVAVERPVMVGVDALIRGDFEGLEEFVRQKEKSSVHESFLSDGVIFNMRNALDRQGQNVAMSYDTIIDFACPSDLGTTNLIIPTASDALYKRICVGEHAG